MNFAHLLKNVTLTVEPRTLAAGSTQATQTREAGFAAGLLEGRKEAQDALAVRLKALDAEASAQRLHRQEELQSRLKTLETLIGAFKSHQAEAAGRQEAAVVSLAYEALLRILGQADVERALVARVVAQAMQASPREATRLVVSCADHARVMSDPAVQSLLADGQIAEVFVEDTYQPGDCTLITGQSVEDLSLAAQLENLTTAWLIALGGARS